MPHYVDETNKYLFSSSISKRNYKRYVWLYHRFILSFRDVKDILAYSGIEVSYESIREWCLKFGIIYVKP